MTPISLTLAQTDLRALSLDVAAAGVRARGSVSAQDLALRLDGQEGEARGSEMEISELAFQSGALAIEAASLSGERMLVGWDGSGVRLEADTLNCPALSLSLGGIQLTLEGCSLHGVRVRGSEISVAQGSVTAIAVHALFGAEKKPLEQRASPKGAPAAQPLALFDWHVLDGLRGEFNVDLEVDLTVPVIGRRRATHRFRIPIDAGALDYMQFEQDLSTLENALLDFAVRDDGTLVLERGLPLLPTRGRGKPILIWRLDPGDLELARRNRVRLAVLPEFEVAASDEAPESKSTGSPISLRSATLGNLEMRLALRMGSRPLTSVLRRLSFDEIALRGEVHHHPEQQSRPGFVRGAAKRLEAAISDLPVAKSLLSLDRLEIDSISEFEVQTSDLSPRVLSCALGPLRVESLSLRTPS